LRTLEEVFMSWLYVLSGLVALVITIYLVIALLFPERF
jgi:K+-transporting ATPase KdpF subunit